MLLDVWGVIIDFMNHDSLVNPLLLWWLHFPSSLHHHLSPWCSSWWCCLPPTQELDFSALAPAQAAAELLRTGDFQQLPRLFNIAGRSCYVQWDVCPSFAPCCSEYGYCRTKVCLKCEPFGWKKERKKGASGNHLNVFPFGPSKPSFFYSIGNYLQNIFAFKNLLLESACVPWIGGRDDCTNFRPSRGGKEIAESESFVKIINLFDSVMFFRQCLRAKVLSK